MSKRFYYDEFTCDIFDEEIEDYPSNREICATLNYQAELIAKLKEQLKNAIVPKFKIEQEVWYMDTRINDFNEQRYMIESYIIEEIVIFEYGIRYVGDDVSMYEEDLFATKEEAQAKLKELQGE